MKTAQETLYDTDFFEWTSRMAELLREGRLDEVDLAHVAEEIEDLGKRDRVEVASRLTVLLQHLVKRQLQPERKDSVSWRHTIVEQRRRVLRILKHSPSLRRYAREDLPEIYRDAVKDASIETRIAAPAIPRDCPWSLDQILDPEFFPE